MNELKNNMNVEVRLVDEWNKDEIIVLYKEGNWWEKNADSALIPLLIRNSFAFAVAIDKKTERAIGMGRVLSDGVSDAYIQDVIVLKSWRKKGIGRQIVDLLVSYCHQQKVTWIALISEPNQKDFYAPLGFKEMQHYVPMKYEHMI